MQASSRLVDQKEWTAKKKLSTTTCIAAGDH